MGVWRSRAEVMGPPKLAVLGDELRRSCSLSAAGNRDEAEEGHGRRRLRGARRWCGRPARMAAGELDAMGGDGDAGEKGEALGGGGGARSEGIERMVVGCG